MLCENALTMFTDPSIAIFWNVPISILMGNLSISLQKWLCITPVVPIINGMIDTFLKNSINRCLKLGNEMEV